MTNTVLQVTTSTQENIQNYYQAYAIERKAPGVIFAAKKNGVSITLYTSGKVLFQGAQAAQECARWHTPSSTTQVPIAKQVGDALPSNLAKLSIIGSDETGTGDYFGPVTVAACYVSAEQIPLLQEIGVADSKQLTDKKMVTIAPYLKEIVTHSTLVVPNDKYNTIQQQGFSQGKIKALLHNQAIKHVLRKIAPTQPEAILIDQFAVRETYYRYLQNEKEVIQNDVLFATKAESLHVAVAAASILARVAFIEAMDKIEQTIGLPIPKGAGKTVDVAAAKIYEQFGEKTLQSITKWHFANTQKVYKLIQQKHRS